MHHFGPGQWMGFFHIANAPDGFVKNGMATLSVEADRPDSAFGCFVEGAHLPASRVDFSYKVDGDKFTAASKSEPWIFNHQNQTLVTAGQHPNVADYIISKEIKAEGKWAGSDIEGTWKGDSGLFGTFRISPAFSGSKNADHIMSWIQYKEWISGLLKGDSHYFRGHGSSLWNLETSFHRTKRYDLIRYTREDCARLAHVINSISTRRYSVNNGVDFGALLNLAQHHGFPTPLLDWTLSPYIAAYFAFSSHAAKRPNSHSRIYIFDAAQWEHDKPQPANTQDPAPAVSMREFESYDNPRALPQQSRHTFCNVADVAGWIQMASPAGKKYLTSVDIPNSDRIEAMRELAYMGINAAALFPGLDGLCRSLKEKYFDLF